jgi:hypothetical protein
MVGVANQQPRTRTNPFKVAALRPVTPPAFPFSVGGVNAMIGLAFTTVA